MIQTELNKEQAVGLKPLEQKDSVEQEISRLTDVLVAQVLDYSLNFQSDETLVILVHPLGVEVCEAVRILAEKKIADAKGKGKVLIQWMNPDADKLMLEGVSKNGFALPLKVDVENRAKKTDLDDKTAYMHYGPGTDKVSALARPKLKVLMISNKLLTSDYEVDAKVESQFDEMMRSYTDQRMVTRYCIVSAPSEAQAKASEMSLHELKLYYLKACDRPWAEVNEAQKGLVDVLKYAQEVEVYVPAPQGKSERWTTHLKLSMKDKVPVNSGSMRNMPGSEVFASPDRYSMYGTYAIPYNFPFHEKIIHGGIFYIEAGKVVKFECDDEAEQKYVQGIFDSEEGVREIGEFALGTNPNVTEPVSVVILIEKMLGIHLAFGAAYKMTKYFDDDVVVDNGVRSKYHIDVARAMTPKWGGGYIKVNGEEIFKDGKYLDPKFAVFNPKE